MLIYKATSPSGKSYIGQTRQLLKDRIRQHKAETFNKNLFGYNYYFHKAIRKYGWENVKWEILEDNIQDEIILNERETFNILKYDTFKPKGYNMDLGGKQRIGYKCSKQTKQRMSLSKKGKVFTSQHRKHLSESLLGNKRTLGTKQTKETIQKRMEKIKGMPLLKLRGKNNKKTFCYEIIDKNNKCYEIITSRELKKFVRENKLSLVMLERYIDKGKIILKTNYERRYVLSKNTEGWELRRKINDNSWS